SFSVCLAFFRTWLVSLELRLMISEERLLPLLLYIKRQGNRLATVFRLHSHKFNPSVKDIKRWPGKQKQGRRRQYLACAPVFVCGQF
ncbi:MAG: hypothetical protein KDD06_29585, partial [Phaeodactylibacter sp.]|nr:hypothetical protein [Phaeodactylibacter sp.]